MSDSLIWGGLASALHTLLDGDARVTCPVYFGFDPSEQDEEAVFVGFEEDDEREWRLIQGGTPPIEQAFRNQIVIQAVRESGTDLKPAYDAVSALGKAVEAVLRENLTLAGVWDLKVENVRRRFLRKDAVRKAIAYLDVKGAARF